MKYFSAVKGATFELIVRPQKLGSYVVPRYDESRFLAPSVIKMREGNSWVDITTKEQQKALQNQMRSDLPEDGLDIVQTPTEYSNLDLENIDVLKRYVDDLVTEGRTTAEDKHTAKKKTSLDDEVGNVDDFFAEE